MRRGGKSGDYAGLEQACGDQHSEKTFERKCKYGIGDGITPARLEEPVIRKRMTKVIGIRFRKAGKVILFQPGVKMRLKQAIM